MISIPQKSINTRNFKLSSFMSLFIQWISVCKLIVLLKGSSFFFGPTVIYYCMTDMPSLLLFFLNILKVFLLFARITCKHCLNIHPSSLQVAVKNNIDVFYFSTLIPLDIFFVEDGKMGTSISHKHTTLRLFQNLINVYSHGVEANTWWTQNTFVNSPQKTKTTLNLYI